MSIQLLVFCSLVLTSVASAQTPQFTLTVEVLKTVGTLAEASGRVVSSPAGIGCSANNGQNICEASFPQGTRVTLTRIPGNGTLDYGWAGACAGTSCQVTMNRDLFVSIAFYNFRESYPNTPVLQSITPNSVRTETSVQTVTITVERRSPAGWPISPSPGGDFIVHFGPYRVMGVWGNSLTITVPLPREVSEHPRELPILLDACADTCMSPNTLKFSVSGCGSGLPQSQGISLIDPVPTLVSGNSVTGDASRLANLSLGRHVEGVAADGVARILLRIPACTAGERITVTLEDENGAPVGSGRSSTYGGLGAAGTSSLSGTSIEVTAAVFNGDSTNPMAFAVYLSPLDFVRDSGDNSAAVRSVNVSAKLPSQAGPIGAEVKITRPPVVLLHGIWSNSETWAFFAPLVRSFRPLVGDERWNILLANYQGTAAASVLNNSVVVRQQILEFLASVRRSTSVAVSQVDIVAHSMGGLIVRAMASKDIYRSRDTFREGFVHKLITIDTPHSGSAFAARLLGTSVDCRSAFTYVGQKRVGDAVRDLAPNSDLLQRLRTSTVPLRTHTAVGIASFNQEVSASLDFNRANGGWLATVCSTLLPTGSFRAVFQEDSDLIVSASSQRGTGLTPNPSSSFVRGSPTTSEHDPIVHTMIPDLFRVGPDALGRSLQGNDYFASPTTIQDKVVTLLQERILGGHFGLMFP
ncbi:MAG: alpha/beta fold hydrolase [Bryobacterales bacterium]|nr:alpha/beta fold hydrolase [Bryobacterales bacterium]